MWYALGSSELRPKSLVGQISYNYLLFALNYCIASNQAIHGKSNPNTD